MLGRITKKTNEPKFSIHEYNALKNEMTQRIVIMNNQAHNAILTIITAWGQVLLYLF